MHEGIVVWADEGDWYLEVRTVCKHLEPDGRCGIYETRPQICRDYGSDEPCEYFTDHLKYDLYFDSDEKFGEWADEQRKKKKRKLQITLPKKDHEPRIWKGSSPVIIHELKDKKSTGT